MASNNILTKLTVMIAANTAEFGKNLQNAQGQLKSFTNGLKNIAAGVGIAFGIREIGQFTFEVSKLAGEADGVKIAFDRLKGSADVLEDLTRATGGTVSELKLMKAAVQANNFQIPIENLAELFKFATLRAQQTGQSVDYLVESIILGIGRKSPLILDNLGISAVRLRQKLNGVSTETATVGDVAKVVGDIAKEELQGMADFSENASSKVQRLSASWENFKVVIGRAANESGILNGILDKTAKLLDDLSGKNDAALGTEILAGAIADNATQESLKFVIDGLKAIRVEAGKPLEFNFVELSEQYKLTGEQADRLRGAILEINQTLSEQESVIKKVQTIAADKHYNDLSLAVEDYRNELSSAIIQEQIAYEQVKKTAISQELAKTVYDKNREAIQRQIDILNSYSKTLVKAEEPIKENTNTLDGLRDKLKSLNEQFESIDLNERRNLALKGQEIIQTQALISELEKLRQKREQLNKLEGKEAAIFNSTGLGQEGSAQFAEGPKSGIDFVKETGVNIDSATENAIDSLNKLDQASAKTTSNVSAQFIDMGGMVGGALSEVAYGLGQSAAGVGNFGDTILRALIGFAKQFGEILIGLGTAALAAKLLIKNPYTAIAAGVALVAIAGAASAAIQKSQSNFNDGGGSVAGARSSSSYANSFTAQDTQNGRLVAEFVIRGKDMWVMLKNYENDNKFTRTVNG